jgi:hypothetical protein
VTSSEAQSARAQKRWAGVPAEERSANSRALALQRWAGNAEDETAIKHYFATEDLDTAMESYQQMRSTFEMIGKLLDGRFQAERQAEEKCSNPACGKKFDRNMPWYYRNAKRHSVTGAVYNEFACSAACMIAIKGVGTEKRA